MTMVGTDEHNTFYLPRYTYGNIKPPVTASVDITDGSCWAGTFHVGKIQTEYFVAKAKRETSIIVGICGANSNELIKPAHVKSLNDRGTTVVYMNLPNGSPNFIRDSETLAEAFLTSGTSPALRVSASNIPRIAYTHSTGGQLFLSFMQQQKTARKLRDIYECALHGAPYLDSTNVSQDYSWAIQRRLFEWYSNKYSDVSPSETPLGKAYIKLRGLHEGLSTEIGANHFLDRMSQRIQAMGQAMRHEFKVGQTYSQIVSLQQRGQNLINTFNAEHCSGLPQILLAGRKDPFACPRTIMAFGARHGFETHISRHASHDPVSDDPHLYKVMLNRIESAEEKARMQAQTITPSARIVMSEGEIPPLPKINGSSDRPARALQFSTSLLNPVTSLLQRFG